MVVMARDTTLASTSLLPSEQACNGYYRKGRKGMLFWVMGFVTLYRMGRF